MKNHLLSSCLLFAFIVFFTTTAMGADFPGRSKEKYKSVPFIEIQSLHKDYKGDQVIIVDVRSDLEYNTIHVDGALHIPVSSGNFKNRVKKLALKHPGKKIAFYCNGTTCLKSYEAQLKATSAGLSQTYAFDLGIPGWAELYPEETLLLGMPMNESTVKWIPKSNFKERCLPWKKFQEMAKDKNSIVIDARDDVQKGIVNKKIMEKMSETQKENLKQFAIKNNKMLNTLKQNNRLIAQPFDKMINNILKQGKMKDQTLLIFDQVGKQVRWLMYQLETEGYSNYYFLSKGAQGVIGIQAYRN